MYVYFWVLKKSLLTLQRAKDILYCQDVAKQTVLGFKNYAEKVTHCYHGVNGQGLKQEKCDGSIDFCEMIIGGNSTVQTPSSVVILSEVSRRFLCFDCPSLFFFCGRQVME